ncbi:MAG TPA: alpha/beta hydrolase [Chloroflexota bacterium]|nr:alpha/beta hydrolase [Chloroflexota bacterium]
MVTAQEQRVRLWQDKVETEVAILGDGPALLYLHGPWGLRGDGAFLEGLAQTHTVYAPRHPGTSASDPDGIAHIDTWWDLMIYYGELLDRLALRAPAVVGHSFGGLVAAELAATMPDRVSRLVLIDPIGLWRDDLPVKNWMILPDDARRRALFAAPDGEAAGRFFGLPEDPGARADAQVDFTWSQACTGKFVWPIPDKGLKKHIHRIQAPTLLIWGQQDGVIAPAYAEEFARGIAGARVEVIEGAGHLPHLERTETVARLVRDFLGQ